MRLDAHHSFSERHPLDYFGSILKRNRFDGSILVHPEPVETPDFVQAVVIAADRIDPAALDRYQANSKFRGLCLRLNGSIPAGLDELQRRNLTLDATGGLPQIPQIAERLPNLRIVIDHLGGPIGSADDWAKQLERAAQYPLVYCKLSGFLAPAGWLPMPDPWPPRPSSPPPVTRPFVHFALSVFGPRRLMFGSVWPDALPKHTWKESLALFTQSLGARTIEEREELLGGSATRFYGL